MQRNTKIVIVIAIAIVISIPIGSTFYEKMKYESKYDSEQTKISEALSNQPTVTVTGIFLYHQFDVDYTSPYSIIPEEKINDILDGKRIYLFFNEKLTPSLQDKRVEVSGKLVENYNDFLLKTVGHKGVNLPVIAVNDIIILDG